jgi:hypothetical protein
VDKQEEEEQPKLTGGGASIERACAACLIDPVRSTVSGCHVLSFNLLLRYLSA